MGGGRRSCRDEKLEFGHEKNKTERLHGRSCLKWLLKRLLDGGV